MVEATLDKWLLKTEETPNVKVRLAREGEIPFLELKEFLVGKYLAYYIRNEGTIVLMPQLGKCTFDEIVNAIDHEMLHHVLTNFVSKKVSKCMDSLLEGRVHKTGIGNERTLLIRHKLSLETFKEDAEP